MEGRKRRKEDEEKGRKSVFHMTSANAFVSKASLSDSCSVDFTATNIKSEM